MGIGGRMDDGDRTLIWAHIRELERKVDLLMQGGGHDSAPPADTVRAADGSPVSGDVLMLLRTGNKIGAIKRHMEETGLSLAAAKRVVDSIS
jgi:ribosomal protein L7/L12